eukprot:scaffold724_cov156-Isochrysis_galbana.AAC.1
MEQTPADARAAPSAPGPTDMATETPPSPKRPRDPSSDNKVSQRDTSFDPVWPEIAGSPNWEGPTQPRTPEIIGHAPGRTVKGEGGRKGVAKRVRLL